MTRYKIVIGFSRSEIERKVNELLLDGWKLTGGVVVSGNGQVFYQAMYGVI